MPANKADLQARLSAIHPGDNALGLFFTTVFSLVEQQAGPSALMKLRTGELAQDFSELRMYPVKDFLQMIYQVADLLEAKMGSPEAVFRACGEYSITRYNSGPGRFLFNVLVRGDPHKLFSMAQIGYNTAVTYGRREYQVLSPKSGVLRANGDMVPPAYHEGILMGSLKVLNIQGRARARAQAIDRVEYDINWN
ncbi:TIGR02265 family protein [Hyalangium versicolor]|uniref:TIGR02265 family protein n=1 Tax=Hyalangium versicolor TaxID=2861190 RepID=UPI001CCA010B|nr:TIGR02265 family protein [Hyalangium versicolor]